MLGPSALAMLIASMLGPGLEEIIFRFDSFRKPTNELSNLFAFSAHHSGPHQNYVHMEAIAVSTISSPFFYSEVRVHELLLHLFDSVAGQYASSS
ncbi:hypothetical protein Tco_1393263 [Tanacetum coccineum]